MILLTVCHSCYFTFFLIAIVRYNPYLFLILQKFFSSFLHPSLNQQTTKKTISHLVSSQDNLYVSFLSSSLQTIELAIIINSKFLSFFRLHLHGSQHRGGAFCRRRRSQTCSVSTPRYVFVLRKLMVFTFLGGR